MGTIEDRNGMDLTEAEDIKKRCQDYTVKVTNRSKGLDQIECLKNYGRKFMTLYRRQGSRPSPWKRNAKKQNSCLGKPYK